MLNNTREYFIANQAIYEEAVRDPLTALLTELSEEFGGKPKVFRPQRDVRFSKDKLPYKTQVGGYLTDAKGGPAYYLQVSAEGFMAATGYYQMASDQLERYRLSLSTHEDAVTLGEDLRNIVARDGVNGETLKTAPRGVPRDAVNIVLLRYKSLVIMETIPLDEADRDAAYKHAASTWRKGKPLNDWLASNVGLSTMPPAR
jgi:uncharacterized protein (TIGR02453 family)